MLLMNRTFLILFTMAVTLGVGFGVAHPTAPPGRAFDSVDSDWTAGMGWRYVKYLEKDVFLRLSIEPMVKGNDRVYVPNQAEWLKNAPAGARDKRSKILARLKSVAWNRRLDWSDCECPFSKLGPDEFFRGSLESTEGGRALEGRHLFEPGSKLPYRQANKLWHDASRMFAEEARGKVTIFMSELIPNSVFQAIELPTLKKNPNVTLVFK